MTSDQSLIITEVLASGTRLVAVDNHVVIAGLALSIRLPVVAHIVF